MSHLKRGREDLSPPSESGEKPAAADRSPDLPAEQRAKRVKHGIEGKKKKIIRFKMEPDLARSIKLGSSLCKRILPDIPLVQKPKESPENAQETEPSFPVTHNAAKFEIETMDDENETDSNGLKKIEKRLKKIEKSLSVQPINVAEELESVKKSLATVEANQQYEKARAIFRHEILFNSIKKVSQDVNQIKQQQSIARKQTKEEGYDEIVINLDPDIPAVDTPKANKKGASAGTPKPVDKGWVSPKTGNRKKDSKRAMEQCLRLFMKQMNDAATADSLCSKGELCIQYAEDLLKMME
ncbi:hypothetical protein B0T26DRAFT_780819 [Lasiosphaeria miniovina]|uniref:Uncharacterized protein n=1 Tax=Lasiosphaeria miniovina TaxID=1954250 RepID=A0AA40DTL4_9PEZI|nr:uncharacterized protein B0T26DRAFT_780819 [Lasiosphaeria miniovina]KAK0712882.1 hypothetical protein B0T26DRAFT_780819 [Lasiosphaeria miniovina]